MLKLKKIVKWSATAALTLALLTAVFVPSITADPAVGSIIVTDSSSNTYADNGTTVISGALELTVTAEAGIDYYELQAGYADIYYIGESGIPEGSFFNPPFEYSDWVTTIGGNIGVSPKTTLSSANSWKVTIPALATGVIYDIRIAAVKNGAEDVVFGHRFVGGLGADIIFTSEFVGSAIVSTAYTTSQVKGIFLVVVYKEGKMVYLEMYDFDSNLTDAQVFNVELAKYPVGQYEYKAFCWGLDYIPLAPAISLR